MCSDAFGVRPQQGRRLFAVGVLLCALVAVGNDRLSAAELTVQLTPDDSALRRNIMAHVGQPGARDALALQRFARHASEQARLALQALGYYRAEVRSDISGEGEHAVLQLTVDAGEPVRLRQVEIRVEGEARTLAAFRLPHSERLQPGAIVHHGAYEDAKQLILNQALRFGFFDGHFTQQTLNIDPAAGVADIHLVYDSGARYRLGTVDFKGTHPFEDRLLQRMVPFARNIPYDADRLAELNQALTSSGYFQDIRLDASREQANGTTLPLNVSVNAREARTLGMGAGVSTDVGPRVRGSFERHWLGTEGHHYGSNFEFSAPRQSVESWYAIPLDPPLTHQVRFTAGYQQEQLLDTDSRRLSLGTEWQRELDNRWTRLVSLRWEQENYQIGADDGQSSLLMPGVRFSKLVSDSRIDPSRGWRAEFALSGAQRTLLSDADIVRAYASARRLVTFEGGHRLLTRAEVGGILSNDFSAIPPSLRFFAGGDQSVRGFDYQTLSPRNAQNERIGARYLMVGSVEYQYPFAERWRLATFLDHGNAFDRASDTLMTGVGLGVRWVSPVGPLRLDVARGIADEGGGFRLHFSMGPEL